jgi:fatty acid synthase subunit beta
MEPAKCLGSKVEAWTWLDSDTVMTECSGISLPAGGATGGGEGGSQGATINSEEFLKHADLEQFAAQHIELYIRYLKRDSRSGNIAFD